MPPQTPGGGLQLAIVQLVIAGAWLLVLVVAYVLFGSKEE